MILVDANILIASVRTQDMRHRRARDWLSSLLSGGDRVGLPWPSLLAFLRLTTNRKVFPGAVSIETGWTTVRGWLAFPGVWVPVPTARHVEILEPLVRIAGERADLISDAHLAALAIEHGLTLCSADGDFARFPGLRWENPLQA